MPSLLHLEVLTSWNPVEISAENRLIHYASIRDRIVILGCGVCRSSNDCILIMLLRVVFVMSGRRVAEELLLDNLMDPWTVAFFEGIWMEHRLESVFL